MKTEILSKEGLEIYDQEIKNYIKLQGGNNTGSGINQSTSTTEPTDQNSGDHWLLEF